MRGLLIAAFVLAATAGCGGGSATPTGPSPIKNASPAFGHDVSQVCEGTYWQMRRQGTHPRPHVDYTSILDHEIARLHQLPAPVRERAGYDQFLMQLAKVESLGANAETSGSFSGFEEVSTAMEGPIDLTVALARELRAPGCLDEFLGRGRHKGVHTFS